jgi:O-antigen biosynthesis protein WbqP
MIRIFDFLFSLIGLIFLSPLIILIFFIGLFDNGSPLFIQSRVGYNLKSFSLIKFRTMPVDVRSAGTHLIKDIKLSSFGYFLRRTKLDEIPQLLNVLFGDMSLVGPRPCLYNQRRLISERKKRGVFKVRPGITGLAQISSIDMKTPTLLAKTDQKMIKDMSLYNYFYYIFKTIFKII